jgi:hypothetical protein
MHTQQTRSAHWTAAQYLVLCDGLTDGHCFMLCCGLVISGATLQRDGNQTDSVTVKGGLTERPAEGGNVVTNTADSSDRFIETGCGGKCCD